jgi:hypothetical protein
MKHREGDHDQVPTCGTTIAAIMRRATFELGVADARAGRGFHRDFDLWQGNAQWSYERGRAWAVLTPKTVALKINGKITPQAIAWFARHGDEIL